jgi:protein gp37
LHRASASESHCYAASLVGRYAGCPGWPTSFDKPEFFAGRIELACRWSDLTGKDRPEKPWLNHHPRTIFVGDLADVFTESLPADWLAPYLTAMAQAPHIWILCTKRPSRARQFFEKHARPPNLWLLTTVTGPATTSRVAELLRVPGMGVRGISLEPMLGPIDLDACGATGTKAIPAQNGGGRGRGIDWLILGGESGPGAHPMQPEWAKLVRDQCIREGIPFFFKQGSAANWPSFNDFASFPDDLQIRQMPARNLR